MPCPVLSGGPWNFHVIVTDDEPDVLWFPPEPDLDVYGKPSICAPDPTPDGPIIYKFVGRNAMGNPVYEFHAE